MRRPSRSDAQAAARVAQEARVHAWRLKAVDHVDALKAMKIANRAASMAEIMELAAGGDQEAIELLEAIQDTRPQPVCDRCGNEPMSGASVCKKCDAFLRREEVP